MRDSSWIQKTVQLLWLAIALCGCVRSYSTPYLGELPAAADYRMEATSGGVMVEDAAVAQALYRAAVRGKPAADSLTEDGRLAELAVAIADHLGPNALLPEPAVVEFLGRRAGFFDPAFQVFLLQQGPLAEVTDALTAALSEHARRAPFTHFGMAPVRAYGGSYWLVVLTERRLQLSPVPRKVEVGAAVQLSGRLPQGYHNPQVRVGRAVSTETVPAGEGPAFDVRIPTPAAGVLHLEVSAEEGEVRKVLAVLPVYVGIDPPDALPKGDPTPGPSAPAAEEVVIQAIQDARRLAKLSPLVLDSKLSDLARAHSVAMADGGFVGHSSPDGLTPAQRVQRAGMAATLVLQNVGRSGDPRELQAEFMRNPGQRGSVLRPDATHLGVGVVAVATGSSTVYYLTELFVGLPEAVDLTTAADTVLGHLNRARQARGASPLVMDQTLSAVAQKGATAFFEPPYPSQQVLVDQANSELSSLSISFGRAAAVMSVVRALAAAANLEIALDPAVTHVGIAVRQGKRPGGSPGAIALLITLGWSRK